MTPVSGTPENIKKYCNESLKRLGIDKIDLYYMHRVILFIIIKYIFSKLYHFFIG